MRKPLPYDCEDCGERIVDRKSNRQKLCKACFYKRQREGKKNWLKIRQLNYGICKSCGKRFEKYDCFRKGRRKKNKRPINAITCSKKCARAWILKRSILKRMNRRRK